MHGRRTEHLMGLRLRKCIELRCDCTLRAKSDTGIYDCLVCIWTSHQSIHCYTVSYVHSRICRLTYDDCSWDADFLTVSCL